MNRSVYRVFKPLLTTLHDKGYKYPVIKCEKIIEFNGNEDLFLEIYFEYCFMKELESATCPKGFELFINEVTDNKLEPTYIIRLSKLYDSGDVLESEISKDVELLIDWANKLVTHKM